MIDYLYILSYLFYLIEIVLIFLFDIRTDSPKGMKRRVWTVKTIDINISSLAEMLPLFH